MSENQGNEYEPEPPEPLEISHGATAVHPLLLVGALVFATIGCVVPVLTMVASLTYSVTWAVTAEYLQWTAGLEPATFGGGFWIASVANLACFAESLRRRVRVQDRDRENPWMPLLGLCILYVLGLSATLYAELARRIDVPDVIHAALLIGFFELVALILPPMLLLVVLRGLRTAWRVSMASAASARRVTGLSTALGICSAFLLSSVVVGGVKGYLESEADDEADGQDRDLLVLEYSPGYDAQHSGLAGPGGALLSVRALSTNRVGAVRNCASNGVNRNSVSLSSICCGTFLK